MISYVALSSIRGPRKGAAGLITAKNGTRERRAGDCWPFWYIYGLTYNGGCVIVGLL